jgi:Arrestin (or S-antigen), N-terminal domain/Arrestin (or S-antigen), C-terminal domain
MNDITIQLNKTEFAGGDKVAGVVIVLLDEDTPFRGIRLMLKGYEHSSWREGSGKHRHTHSDTRSFFDEEFTLQGHPRLGLGELIADSVKGVFSKDGYEALRAGTHKYPFTYVLPPGLPANYESPFGNSRIYYGLKVQVDLPLKIDLQAQEVLVIHGAANPPGAHAVTQHCTKKFLFDPDSQVDAEVHLEKDTVCLGDPLRCRLEVTNSASGKEIRAATLALRQIETLYAKGRSHESQREIISARFEDCQFLYGQCAAADLKLDVPRDLYPTIAAASLVKLDYELQVSLDIPWAMDPKLSVPVKLIPPPEQAME